MNTSTQPHQADTSMSPNVRAQSMLDGRNADSQRRRQRVNAALERAAVEGGEISTSGIARAAVAGSACSA